MATKVIRVYSLDICGNEDEGYELNNVFRTSYTFEIEEGCSDQAMLDAMQTECNLFTEHPVVGENVTVDNWCQEPCAGERFCTIENAKTGKPLFHLGWE